MGYEKHFTNDGGRKIEWGRTSADYAAFRPSYPAEFFERLRMRDIGVAGQALLDLATGVGFLAQQFAEQGAAVVGIDIDAGQIAVARERAAAAGLTIDYRTAPAEATGLPDASFDVATASQCWLYFQQPTTCVEVARVLRPGGRLAICHLNWLTPEEEVVRMSEELVLRYNPQWTGAGWNGEVPNIESRLRPYFESVEMFVFDAPIAFTRESWRGRIRACRGVGASLPDEQVAAFDREHAQLLDEIVPPQFTVLHRIDCHIFRVAGGRGV
jgi:SAM-dependent methyltransferase